MEELITTRCIELLKTPILLRMRREYIAALRCLPDDFPSDSGPREKLDQALDLIESQLSSRGISLEYRDTGDPTTA